VSVDVSRPGVSSRLGSITKLGREGGVDGEQRVGSSLSLPVGGRGTSSVVRGSVLLASTSPREVSGPDVLPVIRSISVSAYSKEMLLAFHGLYPGCHSF
jgi:hypothetical protein